MIHTKKYPHKCKLCGYEWESKKKEPKQCVNCKRMDWDGKKYYDKN